MTNGKVVAVLAIIAGLLLCSCDGKSPSIEDVRPVIEAELQRSAAFDRTDSSMTGVWKMTSLEKTHGKSGSGVVTDFDGPSGRTQNYTVYYKGKLRLENCPKKCWGPEFFIPSEEIAGGPFEAGAELPFASSLGFFKHENEWRVAGYSYRR